MQSSRYFLPPWETALWQANQKIALQRTGLPVLEQACVLLPRCRQAA